MKVNDASKIFQEVVLEIELGNWLELHLFKFFIKYGLIQFSIMGYYFPLKTHPADFAGLGQAKNERQSWRRTRKF